MGKLKRYEVRVAERKAKLDDALARFLAVCAVKADVRAVYVFGSYAIGNIGPTSDLDVLVVRDTDLRLIERGEDLRSEAALPVGLDLIVVRPDEYSEKLRQTGFGHTILDTAKLVYAS